MKQEDPARKAVETLAASVKVPAPPEGLQMGGGRQWLRPRSFLLAAAVVLLVVLAGWTLRRESVPGEDTTSRVVVEHLRLRGVAVPTQVVEFPGADTLLVMAAENTSETAVPADPALALAHLIP